MIGKVGSSVMMNRLGNSEVERRRTSLDIMYIWKHGQMSELPIFVFNNDNLMFCYN